MLCPKCQAETRKFGKDREGNQRFQCKPCKLTFSDRPARPLGEMRLPLDKAVICLRLLVEGNSIRSASRISGINRTTILALLVRMGDRCDELLVGKINKLPVVDVQCDEVWGFVGMKEKTRMRTCPDALDVGDAYCFTAIERESKLILAWHLGTRSREDTIQFAENLAEATTGRFQVTTDGFKPYATAIPDALPFADFAQLVKQYATKGDEGKYSPGEVAELADHLPALPVENLRHARAKMYASFGGGKRRKEMVAALVAHVRAMHAGGPNAAMQAEPAMAELPIHKEEAQSGSQTDPKAAESNPPETPDSSPADAPKPGRTSPNSVAGQFAALARSKDFRKLHDLTFAVLEGKHGDDAKAAVVAALNHNDRKRGGLKDRYDAIKQAFAGTLPPPPEPKNQKSAEDYLQELVREIAGTKAPPKKAGKPKTFAKLIKSFGGISPDDSTIGSHYKSAKEAIENGIPKEIFKPKSKVTGNESSFEEYAEKFARDGYIEVPEGRHATDVLLESLTKEVLTGLDDAQSVYDREQEAFTRAELENKHGTTDPGELAGILRGLLADARSKVTAELLQEQPGDAEGRSQGSRHREPGDEDDDAGSGTEDRSADVGGFVEGEPAPDREPDADAAEDRLYREWLDTIQHAGTDDDPIPLKLAL